MRARQKPCFILSASRIGDSPTAAVMRKQALAADLSALDFSFAECEGCYKGEREPSFVVIAKEFDGVRSERLLLGLGRAYEQESILVIDSTRHASLVYCADGRRESLGAFRSVAPALAKQRDAYTVRNGVYYIAG